MSHASGITLAPDALATFASGEHGMVQLRIADELVVSGATAPAAADSEAAFASALGAIDEMACDGGLVGGEACYVALRLPELAPPACWLLMLYSPPGSSVRDRMLYASTRETVKTELGNSHFASELFGSSKEELSYASYQYAEAGGDAGDMRTDEEVNMEALHIAEITAQGEGGGAGGGANVAFPVAAEAMAAVKALAAGSWVAMSVDIAKETVEMAGTKALVPEEWAANVPVDQPMFYWIKLEAGLHFVYFCPESAPIKAKMLCSTVKSSVLDQATEQGIEAARRCEVRGADEMILSEIVGSDAAAGAAGEKGVQKIERAKAPGGARRKPTRTKR